MNNSGIKFNDISTEMWRKYTFVNGVVVIIKEPLLLNVSDSRGHRILDVLGVSHYIPWGWIHLCWKAKEGAPNFVQ